MDRSRDQRGRGVPALAQLRTAPVLARVWGPALFGPWEQLTWGGTFVHARLCWLALSLWPALAPGSAWRSAARGARCATCTSGRCSCCRRALPPSASSPASTPAPSRTAPTAPSTPIPSVRAPAGDLGPTLLKCIFARAGLEPVLLLQVCHCPRAYTVTKHVVLRLKPAQHCLVQ